VAGADLSPELVLSLGRGLVRYLKESGRPHPEVAVGRDSRLSGDLIESALEAGILAEGGRVHRLGILPTAGVAFTTSRLGLDAGAMISASHNPIADNGVKFFSDQGVKLSDEAEAEIEAAMGKRTVEPFTGTAVGRRGADIGADPYIRHLMGLPFPTYRGRVLVDAAFGAAAPLLPEVLRGAAQVIEVRNGVPDGERINVGCGSTHLEGLQEEIRASADGTVALALDGDADRMLAVDEDGGAVTGDHLVALLAPYFKLKGWMDVEGVALSVLSNLGLREALSEEGIGVVETPVGDRYLIEAMLEKNLALGAEPSGHLVARPWGTTGDGLLTARLVLGALADTGTALRDLTRRLVTYPQLQDAVPVPPKLRSGVASHPIVAERVDMWQRRMDGRGRLLVRPSGTEGLVRVMVETADLAFCREVLDDVLGFIKKAREEVRRGIP